eukprot:NODE_3046_length_1061_cov_24.851779_g2797_i0.p1 GENE.NODE_3046_length_1061_cov_24.851779_g2797_i0~~NODE_3046_length_1061_cov_24.851779_g2797_i0.p1  ORF type:complete len:227 (-),score=28.79 NODE_3046_length_1061_cov_24.851779_g2797_i0:146-826(-)
MAFSYSAVSCLARMSFGHELPSATFLRRIPGASLLAHQEVADLPAVRNVLETSELFELLGKLWPVDPWVTTRHKWLRAVAKGQFTGLHIDRVYFGNFAPSMLTIWIPFGDIEPSQGTVLFASQYRSADAFSEVRAHYNGSRAGRDGRDSGWYSNDAADLEQFGDCGWRCGPMYMGDILLIGPETMHMSTTNQTDALRMSCDTRWHSASESLGALYPVRAQCSAELV